MSSRVRSRQSCTQPTSQLGHSPKALRFPSNTIDAPAIILMGANLLPAKPATYVWERFVVDHIGYFTTFFWGNNSGSNWATLSAAQEEFYGAHPYISKKWEIAANFNDIVTDDNSHNTDVVFNTWHTQAFTAVLNGATYTCKFWWDLPDTTKVITYSFTNNYNACSDPAFVIGRAPWNPSNENFSGDFGRFKCFNSVLSDSDIFSEAADMSQLVTSQGQTDIWIGKTNWRSVDDLSCDYETGRAFAWNDSGNKATLVSR